MQLSLSVLILLTSVLEVGVPYTPKEQVTRQMLSYVMGELTYDYITMVDVDPKAFDYDPDALDKASDPVPSKETIKFLSEVRDPFSQNNEFALADYAGAKSVPQDMFFIPGANIQVEGRTLDYERAPVSVVTQDGQSIIANYPRENVLSVTDNPVYASREKGFYIDKTAVTTGQYHHFMQSTGHPAPAYWDEKTAKRESERPVVDVTYEDALAYATWVGKRLPSYSEYQRAIRKFPELRRGAPTREWTSTVANPGIHPEMHYVEGGEPSVNTRTDRVTGFRCARDIF